MPCQPPRVLSEHLVPVAEPLACLLTAAATDSAEAVAALGAGALLDLAPLAGSARWPAWLAPHQIPAAERLSSLVARYGGAVLADAVGLGKSYVALAVALRLGEPFALVVPAVLVDQWGMLLARFQSAAPILTHESLSAHPDRPLPTSTGPYRLLIVDEAHRFRNPATRRYGALARLAVGVRLLLVTATPVHNRLGDLCHLLRLFLRDHDLTALGVPSLSRAARGDVDAQAIRAAAARLCVARSRERARSGYGAGPAPLAFPRRGATRLIRIGVTADATLARLVDEIARLEAGGDAAALFRLLLLSQLASSVPALRASLARYEAFLEQATAAAAQGRMLSRRDFHRVFPAGEHDVQLALLPLLLPRGPTAVSAADRAALDRVRELATPDDDPKADALARLLDEPAGKTIVFVQARATLRHLQRRLHGHRVAAVAGDFGWFGVERASRAEVLRAFAPVAQRAPAPGPALETDVLLATDLLSEGLNLQDAARVIHYDAPWSPARLTQRVGRIDRAGSPHERIGTVLFLPPPPLAAALDIERRWIAKARAQAHAGMVETELETASETVGFDWCDRLQALAARAAPAQPGTWAAVAAAEAAVVLVVRLAGRVDALVVSGDDVRADPARATELLERAATAQSAPLERATFDRAFRQAIGRAAPLIRARLAAVESARWRAADRDRLSRRLIPWVLAAARRAAAQRRPAELARLDGLVSRLALGMTAGEEALLDDLLARRATLSLSDVLRWHARLSPLAAGADGVESPAVELVAAVVLG